MDAINGIGLTGIQRGLEQVRKSSDTLIQRFNSATDANPAGVASDVVALKAGELQVYASSKVLQVNDELQESVLNIIA